MATIRRDTGPRKDKAGPNTTPLKATSKTNPPPQNNAPKKPTPTTSLRPASRSSSGLKKPTPPDTTAHNKPTNVARKTLDKTPLPTQKTPRVPATPSARPAQKTHVPTIPSPRTRDKTPLPARNTRISTPHSSSLTEKPAAASPNVGLGNNPKPPHKDVGKHSLSSHATPVSATLKTSSVCTQEQETRRSPISATKEQIAESFQESVGNTDIYENLPEVETLLEDQESFTFETVEQMIQAASGDEKDDAVGFVPEDDQEKPSLHIVQIEAEDDAKIVASEISPVLEQQEAPLDIKTQESEEKPCIEEKLEELISVTKIDVSNNITTSVADELPKEEVKEKVVEEVIVVEKEKEKEKEKAVDKKDEVAGQIEVREVVEKQKQEAENKAQKQVWPRVKKDVVSNDKIEETASMLRDQKRNRVRALAGAFESVISSQ